MPNDPKPIFFTTMRRMLPGERLFAPVNDLLIILSGIAHASPSWPVAPSTPNQSQFSV
jgi:hypothetical protein